MKLQILENTLKVIKLKKNDIVPELVLKQDFYSITKTDEELSIVVNEDVDVQSDKIEYNWGAIKIVGMLDFSLIGILSKIAAILAQAEISIFVISTYNTDYILLKVDKLLKAREILKQSGYEFL